MLCINWSRSGPPPSMSDICAKKINMDKMNVSAMPAQLTLAILTGFT